MLTALEAPVETMRKLKRIICLALYYGLMKHLPEHSLPRGRLWLLLRRWTATPLFRKCGREIHINHGVHFGSGSTVSLGDHCGLGIGARLIGDITIGNYVGSAHGITITSSNRAFDELGTPMMFQAKRPDQPVVIEDDVLIFANAIILPGVRVRTGSVIGAGAVVSREVPPNCVVAGNPARVVRWRKMPEPGEYHDKMTPLAGEHLRPKW